MKSLWVRNRKRLAGLTLVLGVAGTYWLFSAASTVDVTTATIQANRINGSVTGGMIPYNDPIFVQMVSDIQAGNYAQSVSEAVNSKYFPYYLPRRMAKQMMSAAMTEAGIPDNDAVAFIVSNWLGLAGTQPTISDVWSQNATYCVGAQYSNLSFASQGIGDGLCSGNMVHMWYINDPYAMDWTTAFVKISGQKVNTPYITLPPKDVGGYMTLSDVVDNGDVNGQYKNFASFAFFGGTNLRAIEYVYEIALGASLASMENTDGVTPDMTPPFVPSNNPNFLAGNNQPACVACHAGGATSRLHGYAVFADKFDFVTNGGMSYVPTPKYTVGDLGKSYGSNDDQDHRAAVLNCDQTANPDVMCNPASPGVSKTQDWDLSYWQKVGLLTRWGWNGPITGSGLNSLGVAVGQATQTYQFMTQRVINEICPTGSFSQTQINNIATGAMNQEAIAKSSSTHVSTAQGPYGYIVVQVASDPSCI